MKSVMTIINLLVACVTLSNPVLDLRGMAPETRAREPKAYEVHAIGIQRSPHGVDRDLGDVRVSIVGADFDSTSLKGEITIALMNRTSGPLRLPWNPHLAQIEKAAKGGYEFQTLTIGITGGDGRQSSTLKSVSLYGTDILNDTWCLLSSGEEARVIVDVPISRASKIENLELTVGIQLESSRVFDKDGILHQEVTQIYRVSSPSIRINRRVPQTK